MDSDSFIAAWKEFGNKLSGNAELIKGLTPLGLAKSLSRLSETLLFSDVALGIPTKRDCEEETLQSAMALCFQAGIQGFSVHSFEVANNREFLVDKCINSGFRRMLFLDSDTVVDVNGVKQLMSTMDRTRASVVAALVKVRESGEYNAWIEDSEGNPVQIKKDQIPTTGVAFPVHHCGLAVALLDLEQIRKIPSPRFARKAEGFKHWGEDQLFAMVVRRNDMELVVDPKVTTIHVTEHLYAHQWKPPAEDGR